jgi:hypothetical protein
VGGVIHRDTYYKPVSTYVIDPMEYVAMGLHVLSKKRGEQRWQEMKDARRKHPDWQKSALFAYGAVIHVHVFPERTAPGMSPPEDWKREAGITESTLHAAKMQLIAEEPEYEAKIAIRKQINEAMDQAYQGTRQ